MVGYNFAWFHFRTVVIGINKQQISLGKKTPELLTFPEGLIGLEGNITGPDVSY